MKIRLMGVPAELEQFKNVIKQIPGIDILSTSDTYANRGLSQEKRIYIECRLNTVYTPAEVVSNLLEVNTNEIH